MIFRIIFVALFYVASSALATEVLWIRMEVDHSYTDVTKSCSARKPRSEFFFAAEHIDGKITRVVLNNYPYVFPYKYIYKNIELTAKEIEKIELYRDPKGRFWLKRFTVPEHVLRWILYWPNEKAIHCSLPQLLSSVSPSMVDYEFETEDLAEGLLISYSQKAMLRGTRSDGKSFEGRLGLVQKLF